MFKLTELKLEEEELIELTEESIVIIELYFHKILKFYVWKSYPLCY